MFLALEERGRRGERENAYRLENAYLFLAHILTCTAVD
jgi:hypothetical protein